jgi:MerR family transcriptional regulator, mercuric resistance operon regulatory protein
MDEQLTIGAASALSGVPIETIRYYEKIGLLRSPIRNANGRRRYNSSDLRVLSFIRRARDLGFRLEDVRSMLRLGAPADGTCEAMLAIAKPHLEKIRSKLRDLKTLEEILTRRSPAAPAPQYLSAPCSTCSTANILPNKKRRTCLFQTTGVLGTAERKECCSAEHHAR